MVCDLTGLDAAGASLLDEGTAAAEAMNMCNSKNKKRNKFFVSENLHPQTIDLLITRAGPVGVELVIGDHNTADFSAKDFSGCIVQYPDTNGTVTDFSQFAAAAHDAGTLVVAATDLLACTQLTPPAEWGADIAVGNTQRFGVPMGFGGPHAAFLACSESYRRIMPGRMIGVSVDSQGNQCLRMALQTREQHIRRDKATSNICTAQALLANMAAFYSMYHGSTGLKDISGRIHTLAAILAKGLQNKGLTIADGEFFDTIKVTGIDAHKIAAACAAQGYNVRVFPCGTACGISVGESCDGADAEALLECFGAGGQDLDALAASVGEAGFGSFARTSEFLTHKVFNAYNSETQMLRLMKKYENKDLSLNHSMMPLGSCTMKLNATSEMVPVTWPEVCDMHPFVPADQCSGYEAMIEELHADLAEITGFAAVSSQPNSGAQGEYAGLRCIRSYHESRGEGHRNICLIPISAHGTNPASAVMAGYKVVVVKSDEQGNIDVQDLRAKADKHKDNLAALMVTYPSTYGVFEESVTEIMDIIHDRGGQVYMDGANMNAQVGWTSPGRIGADVCHLNLHKTFCIPHGGGGPGVGSIGVASQLAPFLPGHVAVPTGGEGSNTVSKNSGSVSSAPFGSAAILPITYMYIQMLGPDGLRNATANAILNANYMANRVKDSYNVLFTGSNGQCAHEFIIDIRPFKEFGIVEEDIAKRLQDYGFHSPTMSWPVVGTLMIEPTESEDRAELDRFCDALIMIREEIDEIASGKVPVADSALKNSPHTQFMYGAETWDRPYSRQKAAFPAPWVKQNKFWPSVARIDNVFGDRNLVCTCPPMETYEELEELA
jgi:glycine dehydrogenase